MRADYSEQNKIRFHLEVTFLVVLSTSYRIGLVALSGLYCARNLYGLDLYAFSLPLMSQDLSIDLKQSAGPDDTITAPK